MSIKEGPPKKGLEEFNFNKEKIFDVEDILKYSKSLSEEWLVDISRQNNIYPNRRNPHLYTQTYIIQDYPLNWKFGSKNLSVLLDQVAFNSIKTIVQYLEKKYDGNSARILLIKLEAEKDVSEHTDGGDYLSSVRRFHIPLITNDEVFYVVNNEKKSMKKGECWEINNLKSHYVLNNSSLDRIHLLIDIMPKKFTELAIDRT